MPPFDAVKAALVPPFANETGVERPTVSDTSVAPVPLPAEIVKPVPAVKLFPEIAEAGILSPA